MRILVPLIAVACLMGMAFAQPLSPTPSPEPTEWTPELIIQVKQITSVQPSPHNKRLVAGGGGREAIKVWKVETGRELLTFAGQGSVQSRTAFSRDGRLPGSLSSRDILRIWRAPSWAKIEAGKRT